MTIGWLIPRPRPRQNDSAISAGAPFENGNSRYTAPATSSAALSTCRSSAWRTIQRIEKRTTNVAAANDDRMTPIAEADRPICAP